MVVVIMILFFVLLSDALVSAWVPGFLQDKLGSPLLMGLVISFQSVVGFVADLIFPELLKVTRLKRLLLYAAILSGSYIGLMFLSTFKPWILIFLVAMAVWGTYYEVLGFVSQQFVADETTVDERTKVWGVMGVFKNLAYFLGPLMANVLIFRGDRTVLATAASLTVFSLLLMWKQKMPQRESLALPGQVNMVKEVSHWWVLIRYAWPVLTVSMILALIDSIFWTTGAVLGESLAKTDKLGSLLLPAYMFPSLIVGFLIAKWGISHGKKKWSEVFILLSGIFLVFFGMGLPVWGDILLVFFSSMMLAVAYPLVDAVYTDLEVRLGSEGKHLMGLVGSMINISYIIGPAAAGYLSLVAGEYRGFQIIGALTVVTMVVLLIVTPRKIRLPQHLIATWGVE